MERGSSWTWFYVNGYIFRKEETPKQFSTLSDLEFDLLTSNNCSARYA